MRRIWLLIMILILIIKFITFTSIAPILIPSRNAIYAGSMISKSQRLQNGVSSHKEISTPATYTGSANGVISNHTLLDIDNLTKKGYIFDESATLGENPHIALPGTIF